jgi:hypothetical protein
MKTYPERRAGLDAMENSITPLTRALRRFSAGKPIGRPVDTPLGAVLLATEQRQRLRGILENEKDIQSPRITRAAITIRLRAAGVPVAFDDGPILVEKGTESEAVRELEGYLKCGHSFTLSGLLFVVEAGDETRVFQYRIERTAEGDAALKSVGETLIQKTKNSQ